MHRVWKLRVAACLILAGAASAAAQEFSDESVDQAIRKGVEYLWSKQGADGSWPAFKAHGKYEFKAGPTAIVCYALLESGVNPQDARMTKALAWLSRQRTNMTYTLGLRCNVWEAADRSTRGKYYKYLVQDAKQLCMSDTRGAYFYYCDGKRHNEWDNSNTQFALLGVWAAARDNLEIPNEYWRAAMNHWVRTQHDDGQWGYKDDKGDKRKTMTVGGIASLYICIDNLFVDQFIQCRGDVNFRPIKKGLDWLDANFKKTMEGDVDYYYCYGLERVALASGYKYFGNLDWYKLGTARLLAAQSPDGSWPKCWDNDLAGTGFALLFLIRGRNAVLFNKLEYEGAWNNRPRDLANLTQWMSRTFERTINWQIINLKVPVSEWHDAPILYIAGSAKPKFSDEDLSKIRTFVLQGGAILSVAECGQQPFRDGIREAYKKLFPAYDLTDCKPDHEIYSNKVHFEVRGGRPKLFVLSNGVRPLAIHSDEDLPLAWQLRRTVTSGASFQISANVAKYVTGSPAALRARGTTAWPPATQTGTLRTVRIARLQHPGPWDPEPLAYERFARLLARDRQIRVELLSGTGIEALPQAKADLATLTGVGPLKLTDAQVQALRAYVEGGGTLLVDAAGGDKDFADSAREVLAKAFPGKPLRRLASDFPVFRMPGLALEQVRYRARTDVRLARTRDPNLQGILLDDRAAVYFSREDVTAALVGYPSYTVDGYAPQSAYEVLRNIVVYLVARPGSPQEMQLGQPGLAYEYYEGQWDKLPDFSRLKPVATGTASTFDLGVAKRQDNFALRFTGFINVTQPGEYTFYLKSDDGSRLEVGGRRVVDHDGMHPDKDEKPGKITLPAGRQPITVTYFEKGGQEALHVAWQGPGVDKQEIPAGVLFHAAHGGG